MKNNDMMTIKIERTKVIDLKMAITSVISDFEDEINSPKTSESRKEIAKKSIKNRWQPLLKTLEEQFKEQDK